MICRVATILDTIVERKREEIVAARAACPAVELEARLADAPAPRGFVQAIRQSATVALIAEVKKASPSAGLIRADFDPVGLARTYAEAGATCISCLTDEPFFQGRLEDLAAIRGAVDRPILRKDFLLDRYQLLEARVAGADAVLLIAECLDESRLPELYHAAGDLGLDVLVELYEPENLERVLALDPPLLGINNRNLATFETDLGHTLRLAGMVPERTTLVAESGVRTRADVQRLAAGGVKAILVGETLMRAECVAEKTCELVGVACG
ncbi:MAG: indole-3-glycerol phosphate synthase [Planctomycetaceae bacterium]|nr:indole-3-glycerol phosphate synthase [Planctomycetaceae bacterium]MDP7274127.1 indole-3-glycerol phosphate synthase TrpC [Planctomycetaceae bacterium]